MKIKKLSVAIIFILLTVLFTSCGTTYTCYKCGKETKEAYYDLKPNKDNVLCEDCAKEYWVDYSYEIFKVE